MPVESGGVWKRHPALIAFALEMRAAGAEGMEIAKAASTHFGERITTSMILSRLKREEVAEIVAPKAGYALGAARIPIAAHPTGLEPRVSIDGDTGELTSAVMENPDPERDALLRGSDLNPLEWEIVGDLSFNKWQGSVPVEAESSDCRCSPRQVPRHHEMRWQFQYKAKLRRYCVKRRAEVLALIEEIKTHLPIPMPAPRGDDATVVCIADLQAGKGDGDGTAGMTRRFLRAIDALEEYVTHQRARGACQGPLYILGLGDLIEGCDGHYAQQTFRAENNERDQVNLVRRLLLKAIERWAPLFSTVVIAAVAGNHGENRRDGKSFTDFADNHDLAIFDQIEDVLAANPAAYGHVTMVIPKDQLALTLDVCGEIVGLTHGHITGSARAKLSSKIKETGSAAKKVLDWWAMQAHGQQPVGDARILFTGHYHHLLITEAGRKTHIQVPALDGGSDWWRNLSGQDARPGMFVCRVGKAVSESGWGSPEIL
jgi:hypothetical protein